MIDFPSSCSKGTVDYPYLGIPHLLCIPLRREREASRLQSHFLASPNLVWIFKDFKSAFILHRSSSDTVLAKCRLVSSVNDFCISERRVDLITSLTRIRSVEDATQLKETIQSGLRSSVRGKGVGRNCSDWRGKYLIRCHSKNELIE